AESDTAHGASMAIEQINKGGGVNSADGVYQLELVTLEAAPTEQSLASDIDTLVGQDVLVLLGPDSNAVLTPDNIALLLDTGLPVLTPATANSLTDNDDTNSLFRMRAPEGLHSSALAAYLLEDLELTQIALVQTDVESTEALALFENELIAAGAQAAAKIQLPAGSPLSPTVQELGGINPQAVVMWGAPGDAVELLEDLRAAGWEGRFAYRHAEEASRSGALPDALGEGVLGVTSWSFGYTGDVSRIFTRDYVQKYAAVPGPMSVAAYDSMWFLSVALRNQSVDANTIKSRLLNTTPPTLVQGILRPVDFGNGDLIRIVMVYELGPGGGPQVVARYDDGVLLTGGAQGAAEVPTPTPTPGPPTDTPAPTATLEGNYARVTVNRLNVRSGPGLEYDQIGQVEANELYEIIGRSPDFAWFTINFNGQVGWVSAEFVTVEGDLGSIPANELPPSPTPALSPTPTIAPTPDLAITQVQLNPTQPIPGQVFTATVTVRNNGGGAAGAFVVQGVFQPGPVIAVANIEGLAAGAEIQAQLTGTLANSGQWTASIVADETKVVLESNEENNTYNLSYLADYPIVANQTNQQITANTEWDLYGGTNDIVWDGFNIGMVNGAKIAVLSGFTYENSHYELINPAQITQTGLTTEQVTSGAIFGIITAEGQRAIMRVDNRQDSTIFVSYRVYN
ncbi:MAG: ABC transporter substrate-binding protein, partial [Chloroflexi bacterium]|nr:ABC transporter substrate-binding protein [Chloroflexota bacterium]